METAMKMRLALVALVFAVGAAPAPSPQSEFGMPSRDLGKAAGHCRPNEAGPAALVTVVGLKDRAGLLRTELYPDNDDDFLQSDKVLVRAGKLFHRVEIALPPSGPMQVCIRLPAAGSYTLSVLHDRDSNRKFGFSTDGVGFPGNAKLGLSKPKAAQTRFVAGAGITTMTVRLNYRRGLLGFGPLKPA